MSVAGFFLLLAIAILLRRLGNRLTPVLMPEGRLKTVAVGWLGGFIGNLVDRLFWQLGPQIAEINLIAAIVGAALFILFLGLFPFIKIAMGKI